MPKPTRRHKAALSTATIFDDAVYYSEALGLPSNRTEADLDTDLVQLAQECGIDPYRFLCPPEDVSTRALSTVTLDSDHGSSSISTHSQETQSTGFTSTNSRTSNDYTYNSERVPAQRSPPNHEQASPTVQLHGQSITVSELLPSSSSSSSSTEPRKRRATDLFGMFRKYSSSSVSQTRQGNHGKARNPKLDCGHSPSPLIIGMHIQIAKQRGDHVLPSCCGKPLPRKYFEGVLLRDEVDPVINSELQSQRSNSIQGSDSSEKQTSMADLSCPSGTTSQLGTSASLPLNPSRRRHEAISIDAALANEAFKDLRYLQKQQFERVSTFECNQQKALSAHYTYMLEQLTMQYEASRHRMLEEHVQEVEDLEDEHVIAEHELLKVHAVETKNVATALKYMEAYCTSSGQWFFHIVTDEDMRKLDRQRLTQKALPQKHRSAINVLRARQEREAKAKLEKQQTELDHLTATYTAARTTPSSDHASDLRKLDATMETRRKRMLQRWTLKFEMWRRDWEAQHSVHVVDMPLEHEKWPSATPSVMAACIPSTSRLAQYVRATA
ncbi:hypothetical protein GQ44DRAFT_817617 [Phaeosphaeriaceae sp. PMI808]|nr:hypothetical protein GQ44DRAFT_817617 [Phaeosphaeriaceae sp. PMI808]